MKGKFRVNKDTQHPDRPYRVEGKVNGVRRRAYFTTREAALEHARLENLQLRNFGQAAANMSADLRIDALAAQRVLAPLGASLTDAAKFYMEHHDLRAKSLSVNAAWQQYEAHITGRFESGTLRKRSLESFIPLMAEFVENFADEQICDLSSQRISQWLHGLPHTAYTKNNYRRTISGFFSYALKRGWIASHPMTGGKVDAREFNIKAQKRPDILSVEQLARLLEVAPSDVVPAIAIGAFCGLRPSEVHALDWRDIHFENAEIDVQPEKAKTARYRYVPMPENLVEWLAPHRKSSGPVFSQSLWTMTKRISAAGRAAGIAVWPADGLRHSYGSYEYARTGSADQTAAQMGHSGVDMLFRHYRNRVREEQALAYFSIRPAQVVAFAA